jgi:hypothetical protein
MRALVAVSCLASIHPSSSNQLKREFSLGSTNKHHCIRAWTTSPPNHLLFLIGEFLAPSTLLCSNRGQAQASACTAGSVSLARHLATSLAHQSSRRLRRPGRWPHALSENLSCSDGAARRACAVLAPRQWNSANARSLTIDGRTPSQDRQDHPNDSFIQQQQPGTQISLNHTTEVLHHWPSQSMSVPWITCMLKDVLCRCVGASRSQSQSQSQSQKGYVCSCPRQLKVLSHNTRGK